MDKTTREYAEGLAEEFSKGTSSPVVYETRTKYYTYGYLHAVQECNVKQLQEENERLREQVDSLTIARDYFHEKYTTLLTTTK